MTDDQPSRPLGREILGFTVAEWLDSGALSTREIDVLLEAQSAGGQYGVDGRAWLVLAQRSASHARRVLELVADDWRRLSNSPPVDVTNKVFAHSFQREAILALDSRSRARHAAALQIVQRLASGGG